MRNLNYDFRALQFNKHVCAFMCFILGSLCTFQVSAQVNQAAAIANIDKQFQRIKLNNALANAAWSLDTYNTSPRFDHYSTGAVTGSNLPTLSTKGALTVAGKPLVIDVVAKPVSASLGKAALALAKSFATPLLVGVALYDLFKDLNITLKRDSNGIVTGDYLVKSLTYICQPWSASYPIAHSPEEVCAQGTDSYIKQVGNDQTMPIALGADGYCRAWNGIGSIYIKPSCETTEGVTQQEIDEVRIEQAISTAPNFKNAETVKRLTKDVLDSGYPLEFDPPVVSGAPSMDGTTTTTQNPDGTTTTKTEKYNFNYSGDNVTYTISNVTTNNNPVTNTTTTTTTTTENPTPEQTDQCAKYPDSIGCSKFGDVPASDPLKKSSHALDITAAAFSGSAACPAPVQVSAMGQTYDISYDPLCDKLALIKPLMLLFAAFVAAYVLADSFKV